MVVGLCAILCCCGCARTNAASCWWRYLTIVSMLAGAILIYPAVIMAGLTGKLGSARDCIAGLVKLGGVTIPGDTDSTVDTIQTIVTVVTVLIFLTLCLRLLVAGMLCFCTPSAATLEKQGGGGMQMQPGNYSAGQLTNGGGGPITRAGV